MVGFWPCCEIRTCCLHPAPWRPTGLGGAGLAFTLWPAARWRATGRHRGHRDVGDWTEALNQPGLFNPVLVMMMSATCIWSNLARVAHRFAAAAITAWITLSAGMCWP